MRVALFLLGLGMVALALSLAKEGQVVLTAIIFGIACIVALHLFLRDRSGKKKGDFR